MSIEKLFIPYAMALTAKEKGFNERCVAGYSISGIFLENHRQINSVTLDGACMAPLYQQMIDWLRDVKGIDVWVESYQNKSESHGIVSDFLPKVNGKTFGKGVFDDYYEAIDKAIEVAFKLI